MRSDIEFSHSFFHFFFFFQGENIELISDCLVHVNLFKTDTVYLQHYINLSLQRFYSV